MRPTVLTSRVSWRSLVRGLAGRTGRWLALAALLAICVWGAQRLATAAWYVRIAGPVSGSFAAGPVNQLFSAGQTVDQTVEQAGARVGVPVARIDLKLAHDSPGGSAEALVEIRESVAGRSLRSGIVPLRRGAFWYALTFPPITPAENRTRQLYVEIRTPQSPVLSDRDRVAVFYEQGDHYAGGRMYTRGEPARPDWDLAFRMYRPARLREALAVIDRWQLIGVAAPWVVAAGAGAAVGAAGWLVWRRDRAGTRLWWTPLLVALALLALALHLPDALANPAIVTATVELH